MKLTFLLRSLLLALCFALPTAARAQLLITPLQVTMEGRNRSSEIVLVNTTQRTNTYRLEWEQVELDPATGRYKDSDMTSGQLFLQTFAVFTPRQITLGPGEKQNVRIAVRRPADLPDGEYKSHLKFRILTSEAPPLPEGKPPLDKDKIRIGVQVNASFTIPIVYRAGEYDTAVTLGEARFETNQKTGNVTVVVPLQRSGIHGAIGQIDVFFKPDGGKEALLGSLSNANLFPEITSRTFNVPTQTQRLTSGTLRIAYVKAEGNKSNYTVLTERSYPVGG